MNRCIYCRIVTLCLVFRLRKGKGDGQVSLLSPSIITLHVWRWHIPAGWVWTRCFRNLSNRLMNLSSIRWNFCPYQFTITRLRDCPNTLRYSNLRIYFNISSFGIVLNPIAICISCLKMSLLISENKLALNDLNFFSSIFLSLRNVRSIPITECMS